MIVTVYPSDVLTGIEKVGATPGSNAPPLSEAEASLSPTWVTVTVTSDQPAVPSPDTTTEPPTTVTTALLVAV